MLEIKKTSPKDDCWVCCSKFVVLVDVGEDWDYKSATTRVCKACLLKAVALIEEEEQREIEG